ncbi:MAG TPA: alpha/beta fold hydrolase [Stellaceae bacterium]|nr:alpha/beta fold hydrolase [Stellaceae bacterium]
MAAKTPLVLLPGLLCDRALWASQITALADITAPIVADLTRDHSMGAMADRVLAMAPERFALAGLSMGGYVAQEILHRAPHRVTALALLDTSARADSPEQTARRRGLIALATKGEFKGVTPRLLPLLVHEKRLRDDPLIEAIMAMAQRVGSEAFLRQQEAIIGRRDRRDELSRIAVPTLILCGRDDQLTPLALHEEMAAHIPKPTLTVIEECGHLSTMECPEKVNQALRTWLRA